MTGSITARTGAPSRWLGAPILLGAIFFGLASTSVALTRFDGGAAFLWPATSPLLAVLVDRPPRKWLPFVAAAAFASWCASSLFGLGPVAGLPIAAAVTGEAMVSAVLLRARRDDVLDFYSIDALAYFLLAAGLASPALSALLGAAIIAAHTGHSFWPNWFAWFVAHGLGTVTFAPLSVMVLRGELATWLRKASLRCKVEAALLLLWMTLTTISVFDQERRPLLFLPLLPLFITTFRLGRIGAAMSLVLLTLIGATLTADGHGPISLIQGPIGERAQFLQFYLAVALLMALPATAELKRRERIFQRMQESEATYRVIADNVGDTILHTSTGGEIRYASPSVAELSGFDDTALIGQTLDNFIHPDDLVNLRAARLDALSDTSRTVTIEYRGSTCEHGFQWRETRLRSYVDSDGQATGLVMVVRDITRRKNLEIELAAIATTDPLTRLPNRRAFDEHLADVLARVRTRATNACVAILDIDHFKRVNDLYGHPIGDRVLQEFADTARRTLRGSDVLARIGGEEFGIILDGTDLTQATRTCERVRTAVEHCQVGRTATTFIAVTVSIGVVQLGRHLTADQCFRFADQALYKAKASGRNRLQVG